MLTAIFIVFSGPVSFLKTFNSCIITTHPRLFNTNKVTFDLETEIDFHKYKTCPQCEQSVCKERRVQ